MKKNKKSVESVPVENQPEVNQTQIEVAPPTPPVAPFQVVDEIPAPPERTSKWRRTLEEMSKAANDAQKPVMQVIKTNAQISVKKNAKEMGIPVTFRSVDGAIALYVSPKVEEKV